MIARNYHCINRFLYATSSLLVLSVCAYKLHEQNMGQILDLSSSNYQNLLAVLALLVTAIWGGYFLLLRYRVDEQGISKRILRSQELRWDEITEIDLQEIEQNGQAHKKLSFKTADERSLSISSELLSLENMEELISDLREAGKLT